VCLWAPIGVPDARWCPKERPLGYVNRKPGPAPWGLPPPGPASAPLGGRAWPRALPRQREGGLPGRGVSESVGRGAPKEGPGPKGSTGEGTPRRDPGGPAGRSRPNGRVGGHQTATATAATAHSWRRGPAAQGQPRPSPGPNGARRPGASPGRPRRNRGGFEEPHNLLREESGAAAKGRRGALRPLGPLGASSPRGEKPPLLGPPTGGPTPRPHRAGGLLFVRGFVKVRFCAGVTLLQPKAAYRPSPPARPLPPGLG
jgi:hypothetical protein